MLTIAKPRSSGNNGHSNGNGKPAEISQRISKHLLERHREKLKPRPRDPYSEPNEADGTNGTHDAATTAPPKQTTGKTKKSPSSATPLKDAHKRALKAKKTKAEAKKGKTKGKSKAEPKSTKLAHADGGDGRSAPKPKTKRKSSPEPTCRPKEEDEYRSDLREAKEPEEVEEVQERGTRPRPKIENEPPFVFVPLWIIKTIGANTAAVVLAQTLYWLNPGRGRRTRLKPTPKDGRSWTPSCREITEQTGLSRRQIDGALRILVKRKRIEDHKAPGSRRRVIRLTKGFHVWLLSKGHLTTGPKIYSGRGVKVGAAEVAVTGSIPQALVLSNILFWWEPNSEGKSKLTLYDPEDEGGHGWRYYTRGQMAAETGLNPGQVKTALRSLRRDRLIVTRRRTCRSRRTGDFMTLIDLRPDLAVLDQQYGRQSSE